MAASGERLFQANPPHPKPQISQGLRFQDACIHHARNTFHARRIYVVVSSSISRTEAWTSFQSALGDHLVGVHYGIPPHTPWDDVLQVARDLKGIGPELIITLGGGSVTDAVKLACFAYSNGAFTEEDLEMLERKSQKTSESDAMCFRIPTINIPTTLSGAEYTTMAGATDARTGRKARFRHPSMIADLIILDPQLCLSTPEKVWLSTGVGAVDRCVEGLCYKDSRETDEERKLQEHSLRLLLPNLLTTKIHPDDLDARSQTMLAVAPCLLAVDIGLGASHGIGHQLGPLGVPHGETSCVTLPAVMKYNYEHGDEQIRSRQQQVREIFWSEPTVSEALVGQGLTKTNSDAGDAVDAFVKALGMPRSLRAVGIGRDKFDSLADSSVNDFCTKANPVPLAKEDVLAILEMASGD